MLTPYDRKQQARERRQRLAQQELAAFDKTGIVVIERDWDAGLVKLLSGNIAPAKLTDSPAAPWR